MRLGQYNNFIMSIIGILGMALTIFLGANQMGIWFVISMICLILFLSGYALYIFVYLVRNRLKIFRILNYLTFPKGAFIVSKRESTYEFADRTHIKHVKKVRLRSLANNLHEFTDRYKWSKNVLCEMRELVAGQTIGRKWSDIHWNYYSIILDRHYIKGQECDTGIIMPDLVDDGMESELFLSTGIFEPTRELVLRVKALNPMRFKGAAISIYKSYFDLAAMSTEDLDPVYDGGSSELVFRCQYPLMGAKYMIEWRFEDEGPVAPGDA